MKKLMFVTISVILAMSLSVAFDVFARPPAATSPPLGASGSFSVLAGSTVTNTGSSTVMGDVGVSAGTAITGFPPGVVGPPGTLHSNDAEAIAAQADNLAIFGLLDQGCDQTFGAVDLATTFPAGVNPGTYCSTSSFSLTGNLTLNGSSGVWIFKSVSTLLITSGASVTGGDPCNVWWRVGSSATLDSTSSMIGNIYALTDINMFTGATLNGRVQAQTGQVVLDTNNIYGPICAVQATVTPTVTPETGLATATPTSTLLPIVTALPGSGGAPIRSDEFPWILVIIAGFSAVALVLVVQDYRRTYRPK
jgi:hypothetical protein